MKGICLRKVHKGVIWGALIVMLLASPSFAQTQPEKSGPLTIQKIETAAAGKGSRVVIEGSAPFEYTIFKGANPERVVVDLPKAQLGKLSGPIEVRNGTINVIRNRQTEYGARVEIGLDQDVEYQVFSDDNYIYVEFAAPTPVGSQEMKAKATPTVKAAAAPALQEKPKEISAGPRAVKEISVLENGDWVEVILKADEPLIDYRSFQLSRPARLVVDLPKTTNASSKRLIDVGNPLLRDIRIGQYPEKVRLVFTFPGAQIPPYQMAKEGEGLKVLLGEGKSKQAAPMTQAAAATPPVVEKKENLNVGEKKSEPIPPPPAIQVAQAAPSAAEKKEEPKVTETKPEPVPQPSAIQVTQVTPPIAEKKEEPKIVDKKGTPPPTAASPKGNGSEKEPAAEVKISDRDKAQLSSYRGAKISLDFKDADIHNIFRLIAEVSNLNIITTDDVKGRVTIRLVNVPWDQALDVILQTKNLIKIEEGNVLRITTLESVRKEREEREKEQEIRVKSIENKEKVEDLVTQEIRLNYAKALDIMRLIMGVMPPGAGMAMPAPAAGGVTAARGLLGPRGSVRADERTNIVIVRDTASRVEDIQNMVRKLDFPTPQVLIEARVVQAETSFARSLGVQWGGSINATPGSQGGWAAGLTGLALGVAPGFGFSPGGTTPTGGTIPPSNISVPSGYVVNFPASIANTPVGGMGISFGKLTGNLVNLDLRLQLGETDRVTKVISRPKLATLNNTKAHIKQGELIPYETTSQAGTQVQFIDAVLLLEVTPLVTPDGSIKMLVKVTRDARGLFRTQINQVPSIDKREASTEVLVKDGETIVIGGIYESENTEIVQGIPWMKDVPILGWLFKSQDKSSTKRELLIFITPTILQLQGKSES